MKNPFDELAADELGANFQTALTWWSELTAAERFTLGAALVGESTNADCGTRLRGNLSMIAVSLLERTRKERKAKP